MSNCVLFDKATDLSFVLEAGPLREVGFGAYTLHLHFAALHIVVNSPCEVTAPGGAVETWKPEHELGNLKMFAALMGSEIKSHRVTRRPELLLEFTNGWQLALIDHQEGYESFVLWLKDGSYLAIN
jgi:hypothetical protein